MISENSPSLYSISPVIPNKPNCTTKKKKKPPLKFKVYVVVLSLKKKKKNFFTIDPNRTAA